jgi:hypothetical protein
LIRWFLVLQLSGFLQLALGGIAGATTFWVSITGGSTGNCGTAVGASDPNIYLRSIGAAIN